MKHQIKLKKDRGFSLVEMLVVIAVIGIIAAIAVPTIGSVTGKANESKTKRNAQNIASLYNASRGVGAEYPTKTTSGIIDKLVEGVTGQDLDGSDFQMPGLADAEKTAAMKYVSYDSDTDMMSYDPSGGQEQEQQWTPWMRNGSYPTQARAQLQNDSIAEDLPGAEFKVDDSDNDSTPWVAWRREPL